MEIKEKFILLLKTSRPIFWPLMIAVYIGGVFVSGAQITILSIIEILILTFPIAILTFGINDIYDYETDKKNSRKKDVEGLILKPKYHSFVKKSAFASVIFILITGIIISIIHNDWQYILVLSIITLLAYIYSAKPIRLKEIPVIDSLTNGFAVIIMASWGFLHGKSLLELPLKAIFIGLAIAGFHALTTIPDYKADKKARVKTFSTVLGKKSAALFAFITLILLLIFSGIISNIIISYIILSALLVLSVFFYPEEKYSLIICKIIFLLTITAMIIFMLF